MEVLIARYYEKREPFHLSSPELTDTDSMEGSFSLENDTTRSDDEILAGSLEVL